MLLATLNVFGNRGSLSSYRVDPHPEKTRKEACPGAGPISQATGEAVSLSLNYRSTRSAVPAE